MDAPLTSCATDDKPGLRLAGELTIQNAATLREHMQSWLLQVNGPVDLSQVTACDSAGVQLLIALRHSLLAQGLNADFQCPTPALSEVFQRYGLSEMLATA